MQREIVEVECRSAFTFVGFSYGDCRVPLTTVSVVACAFVAALLHLNNPYVADDRTNTWSTPYRTMSVRAAFPSFQPDTPQSDGVPGMGTVARSCGGVLRAVP